MSLKEAGNLLGLKPNSVRSRYKKGQIRGEADNLGKLWVFLDPSKIAPSKVTIEPNSKPSIEPDLPVEIIALQAKVEALTQELARADAALVKADAELGVLRPLASDVARLEAEGAGLRSQIELMDRANTEKVRLMDDLMRLMMQQRDARKGFWGFFKR